MSDALVKVLGWKATVLHGDPCVYDRWRWLQRHLRPGPLRTLDAGSGSGALTMYAARLGNEAVGVSFDARNNEVARARAGLLGIRNVEFLEGDLRDLESFSHRLGTFDQVICLETIEHIRDDQKLVADLASLLRPGGRLLLTTPFKHYRPLLGDRLSDGDDGGHVRWGYTHDEMRALFERAGLTVVTEEMVSGVVSQQLTNLLRLIGRRYGRLGWAMTFPLRALRPLDRPLTALLRYPHIDIAVVGVRNA